MTPQRLGLLIVEGAAAKGRNVATDLRALSSAARHEVFSRAASLAEAGHLRDALAALGAPSIVARAAGQWPMVLQPARLAVEQLPSTRQLGFGLSVLAGFCFILAFVQLAVGALLASKVMPAFAGFQHGVSPADPRSALALLLPVQAVVWLAAVLAVGWKRAPWNRDLELAAHAVVASTLVDSKAPTEVVTSWLASEPRLAVAAGAGVLADDLRSVADSFAARADASMRRFLAGFRFIAIGLLVIEAAWMAREVLVTLSRLPGAFL
ncbi:MAG: hypothetical protein Q8N26_13740 [Myxococcales bacterium]|nr:hypothetical protein [Myxococcales bacterium]